MKNKLGFASLVLTGSIFVLSSGKAGAVTLLSQDWSDAGLITTSDNWSSLWNSTTGYGIIGYRGDELTIATGVDPQTVLTDGTLVVDVNANQTNPNTFTTGGVAEFAGVVALSGSGTADAPSLVFSVSAIGFTNVSISYTLKDLENGTDNAIQSAALQYRVSNSGSWTNISSAYVSDVTSGPSLFAADTPISASLGSIGAGFAYVQFRVITTNAVGNDEWIGVDNILITATAVPEPSSYAAIFGGFALVGAMTTRRRRA